MKKSSFLYVANWKMQFSFEESLLFCKKNKHSFTRLASLDTINIVLCPSFDALYSIVQLFTDSSVSIGAQNCAAYKKGAYTGEVSASSLAQVGCTFCIVGHSERRSYYGEIDEDINRKIKCLMQSFITPIICVGETKEEYEKKEVMAVVGRQVRSVCQMIKTNDLSAEFYIAYEPIWSIGTGLIPSNEYIESVFDLIRSIIKEVIAQQRGIVLYGGSVDYQSAKQIMLVRGIGGFLVGGASLDFQKFEKIVT